MSWYPPTITVAASAEPVTLAQARSQCRLEASDTDSDNDLTRYIASARGYCEAYCGTPFASQTVTINADSFDDFARLPIAPVSSILSISYVDTAGATQTLATSVWQLWADGLEASIQLKYGQSWPSIQDRSRITVTAVVGYTAAPDPVIHAMLLFIEDSFNQRENAKAEDWTAIDCLLTNYRRFI